VVAWAVVQCSIRPGHKDRFSRDHQCMKRIAPSHRKLMALAIATLPMAATAIAVMLDQSVRRPSVARLVMHSLQLVS
jgi:hypothetical protein